MKKKTKQILGTISIILGLFLIVFFLTGGNLKFLSIGTFEFGFLPYAESQNMITDLEQIDSSEKVYNFDPIRSVTTGFFNSKYWEIESPISSSFPKGGGSKYATHSGNDFELKTTGQHGGFVNYVSTEYFDERDFKADLICNAGGESGSIWVSIGGCGGSISLVGDSGEKVIGNIIGLEGVKSSEANFVVKPSVVSDNVDFYWNGKKINSINYSGKYKIKINAVVNHGNIGQNKNEETTLIIKNPSYKQQFGCTIEPNEQYYVSILNEGDIVNIDKLDRFTKFCLDESPLKIWTNIGSTTETSILEDLVNDEQFTVPLGQVWSIEYIGEKSTFVTECEADETYNLNEDQCMSRTVISLTCPEDSFFDFERGICIIETLPLPYDLSDILTHQTLQNGRQFRFTHIFEEISTPSSFNIGQDIFNSFGLEYSGIETGIAYPEDKVNWRASFGFNGQFEGLEEEFKLNDWLSVEITDIEGYKSSKGKLRYKVEYTFSVNPDFLTTTYEDGKVIVFNDLGTFDGGITVTKTDNLGTTTINQMEKTLGEETIFEIDTENLLELKVRPFIKINTDFEYAFDGTNAITVDFETDKGEPEPKVTIEEETNFKLIFGIIGIILLIVILVFVYWKIK